MKLFKDPKRFLHELTRPVAEASAARTDYRRIEIPVHEEDRDAGEAVPWSLRVAGAWSWRFIVVVAAFSIIAYGLTYVEEIVVPVLVALLLAVILHPMHRFFCRFVPAVWAATVSMLIGITVVAGMVSVASTQIVSSIYGISSKAQDGFHQLIVWLQDGPLQLDQGQIKDFLNQLQSEAMSTLQRNSSTLASGALTATASIGTLVTGALITLFCLFFLLKDGRQMWVWALRLLPKGAREPLHEACVRGWVTLGSYARTQIVVAAIDSASIGIVAYLIGIHLAIPLAVIIFIGSLIPIVGIIVTGGLAVLVVLVDSGPWMALAMVGIIAVAYMVEGSLLQPLLMSGAVNLHPVAVLLSVTAGGLIASVPGALFAVPIVAFINTVVLYLHGYDKFPALAHDEKRVGGTSKAIIAEIEGTKAMLQTEAEEAKAEAEEEAREEEAEASDDESNSESGDQPEEKHDTQ